MATYTYPADKFYWGHYLNLGRHHATVILQSIVEKCKIAETINENSWGDDKFFKELENTYLKGKPEIEVLFSDELRHHFPFLRCLDTEATADEDVQQLTWQDYFKVIKTVVTLLSDRRNVCNHHDHDPLVAIQAEEMAIFDAIWKKLLAEMINRKADGTKKHPNDQYPEKYYGNTKQEREDSLVHLCDFQLFDADDFSEKGLSFLVCLFLERADAVLFVSNLTDFPANARANRDAFSHFSCRLPQPKLVSSNVKLDALNELARCPNELWAILSSENQERFFAKSHDSDDENPTGTYMRRGDDSRFNYFALQYVDEAHLLGDLSFQLHLGKIRLSTYSKTMVSTLQTRELVRDIYVFGKLKEYKDKDPVNLFGEEIASRIEQYAPKYALLGNNIAMKIVPSDIKSVKAKLNDWIAKGKVREDLRNAETLAETLTTAGIEINAAETISNETNTEHAPETEADNQADYILSANDVFGLVFYAYLQKNEVITNHISDFLANYKTQFGGFIKNVQTETFKPLDWKFNQFVKERPVQPKLTNYEDEKAQQKYNKEKEKYDRDMESYDKYLISLKSCTQKLQTQITRSFPLLKTSHLPDKILHHLLGYKTKTTLQIAKAKIQAKEHETYLLLKDWKRNEADNLPLKDYKPRAGELGAWLAKDIIFLMPYQNNDPKTNRGRPNDQQANKLQKLLAIYDTAELWDYFQELGLLNYENKDLAHPFLYRLKKEKAQLLSIQDFYQFYLNKRTAFFKSFFPYNKETRVKSSKLDTESDILDKNNYWLKLDFKKVVAADPVLQKDYTKPPFALPRGIFNDTIIAALRNAGYSITRTGKGDDKQPSLTHCMEQFCNKDKKKQDFDRQDFYDFERIFKFKKTDKEGILRSDAATYYQTDLKTIDKDIKKAELERKQKQILKKIEEQDKTIRLVMAQDRLMLLILKDWWSLETEHPLDTAGFRLANLEASLNTPYDMEVKLPYKTNEKETITKEDGTTEERYKESIKIITATLPLKRYGELRKEVKDIRLLLETKWQSRNPLTYSIESGLFAWFDAPKIPLVRIKAELAYYDTNRHKVTEAIINWEYKISNIVQRPSYSKLNDRITSYDRPKYTDHLAYLLSFFLTREQIDTLHEVATNIVQHTRNIHSTRDSNKKQRPIGLTDERIKTYISEQCTAANLTHTNLVEEWSRITIAFYQNMKEIKPENKMIIELYDKGLVLYKNEMPVIEHLKMLRHKFAHNQIRYDAALDNTSTIKRVQNGQETEGCQTQPNSTNRYIEEVCLIDKKKLITAQLIKYTTEQYNAL